MAGDEFRVRHNWTLGQCQDRITVLEGEKEQLTTELAGTKAQLNEVTRERDTSWAKVARGIVHNKNRDWDDPPEVRQSWLEWWESRNFAMEHIVTAYRKSCVENNINSGLKKKSRHALRYVEMDAVRRPIGILVDPEENFEMDKHFPFQRLIQELPEVAREIAIMTMYKGSVIHFIARLDRTEEYPPRQQIDMASGLPMRFWWGPGKSVHINSAPKIQEALAPLYVCRDFAEIFGNAFWSRNKFSFASFGELHIFRRNMRRSYIERIVQIELWWQGSKNTLPIDCDPETVERFDHRTWPLSVLTWMKRLKFLEVYVDESSNMRRSNEPENVRDVLAEATRGINHENNRQLRDLRKLHGTDYLYQLRGMRRIRFYDSNQPEKREQVVDDSFVRDMRAQITQRKSRLRGEESRLENLKPLFRRGEGRPAYERSRQVEWIFRSLFDPKLKWGKWKDDHRAPNDGAGDEGDGDDAPEDDNGGGGEDPGHGDNGPQNRDNDSDSDSSDDSDPNPGSLFVHQPNPNGVVYQPSRFHGRRNMGRGANGSPTHGFTEAIEIDSDDEDDDDIIVDEERSAPANRWGMQVDLTNIPNEEYEQVKEEDMNLDVGGVPPPNAAEDANLVTDDYGVKSDDGIAPAAPAPQPESAAGNGAQSQEPKADEDVNVPDIYGASPGLEDGVAGPPGPNMILQMRQNGEGQAQGVQVADAEISVPQDAFAASIIVAQSPIPDAWESRMPSVGRPEQPIIIDLDDYDDDVQFIEARFEPIKIDDDEDPPPLEEILAKSRRFNSSSAPTQGRDANVKVEDSASASAGYTQSTLNVMREAASLRRSLTPAGRYVTPDPYATPSSSPAADEDEDELDFDTPTPEAPRASDPRRDRSSFSCENTSVRPPATSRKRSRDEDTSTPRSVDTDQVVPPSRRSSRSSRSSGISVSVTRGVDELDLMGNQHDGAGDSQPPKRKRDSPREQSESDADIAKIQQSWLKSLPKK